MSIKKILAIFVFLQFLDIVTTYAGLSLGISEGFIFIPHPTSPIWLPMKLLLSAVFVLWMCLINAYGGEVGKTISKTASLTFTMYTLIIVLNNLTCIRIFTGL